MHLIRSYSFAEKKDMRQLMMILIAALSLSTCKAHNTRRCLSGIDLSAILRQHKAEFFSGISVNDKWSVSAEVSLQLPYICRDQMNRHLEDLGIIRPGSNPDSSDKLEAGISAQYWIRETFLGPFLSFGLGSSHSIDISCPMMIGYMCRIWRGIKIITAYDIELISTFQQRDICGNGLRLSLCYEF